MRLIDLDQTIFVPIVDETQDGVEYETQMTIAEMFDKFLDGCCPETVDAIPVEWIGNMLQHWLKGSATLEMCLGITEMLHMWQKEQEER